MQVLFAGELFFKSFYLCCLPFKSGEMNAEDIREYCLKKGEVTESLPFNDSALVFKVNGKMFALLSLESALQISLKCDPEVAVSLRDCFSSVVPGYHMNKRLWNTINIDGSIDEALIYQWIDDSYRLVVEKMPKKDRQRLLS